MTNVDIKPFFDLVTNTVTYLVTDLATSQAAIIDPVLDFDPNSGKISSSSADKVIAYIDEKSLTLEWILETHVHADHVTAASYLKAKRGGCIGIGKYITKVQSTFKKIFNMNGNMVCDGTQFDQLFDDGEVIKLGHVDITIMHTPGHTPACVSYKIDDALFVGDTLFMPDYGTARTDFPSGSAKTLYQSIQRILSLPDNTRVFVGHDYKSATRNEYEWETTIIQEKLHNIHIKKGVSEADYVLMRDARDASLPVPRLLLPSIQLNIQAGRLPQQESNGTRYLKIPLSLELN